MGEDRKLKSAYEIALEKLKKKGEGPIVELSDEKKAEISELRREYKAKIAELEIMHKSQLAKLPPGVPEREKEEDDFVSRRKRLEGELEEKILKVKEEK
jgi:hypothetical protein